MRRVRLSLAVAALAAFFVVAVTAGGADTFTVRLVSQTTSTITLGWDPQPGYGYLFSAGGTLVSRTNNAGRDSVKFAKVTPASYDVDVIVKGANGHYPAAAPPPPPAACADGVDNDGDGKVDLADPGCSSASDTDETDTPPPPPPPPPTGFPDASNTGVPAGTTLTAYTGPFTITTPNTVIDSKNISGCLRITTTGVTIRNSYLHANCDFMVDVRGSGTSVTVRDTEIDCQNYSGGGNGIVGDNVVALRVNIHRCENGGSIDGDWDLRDSYIHDFFMNNPTTHSDGLQTFGGVSNVQIVHNTIIADDEQAPGSQYPTSAIIADETGHSNWLIANNKLGGGGFTVYCATSPPSNWVIRDNAFTNAPVPPAYGFSRGCARTGITQSGNYVYETGQPLSLD